MPSYMRRAMRTDANQKAIVKALRDIPNVSVAVNHDDILVGYGGKTYWFEIKIPDRIDKDGKLKTSTLRPSQEKLLIGWKGHYSVVSTLKEILNEIGLKC